MQIIIVGAGVAGAEAGTYLGQRAREPLEIVEIEHEPMRRFGGWGFQRFPESETTNLAFRKMYLGRDPEEILRWVEDAEVRASWPPALREAAFSPDRPIPRPLIQRYVAWRRARVDNPLVTYRPVTGEAMRVQLEGDDRVAVTLRSGERLVADRVIMASGSIAVKVPDYLEAFREHDRVIVDPLTLEGHERRAAIPTDARVLILGTGLTGEEQASLLFRRGHRALTLLSRNGYRHYAYPEDQKNEPLVLDELPDFLRADTAEEFDEGLSDFFERFVAKGHGHEDILAAIRPFWDVMRRELGGCHEAADVLHRFRRSLAVSSIGASHEVATRLVTAESEGALEIVRGQIETIEDRDEAFQVRYQDVDEPARPTRTVVVDVIINAVGRTIIRHPIWERLLEDGLAAKHAGIGIRVSETGQMVDAAGEASDRVWVVGMARAGDHALRHGFLGNTAFNVPQVRAHLYDTIDALLGDPCPRHASRMDEVLFLLARDGLDARLSHGDETPLIWAVSEGYSAIVLALIEAGAALDARNGRGNTALIRAACEGRLELTRALIDAGAALDVQNEDGYGAALLAKRRGHDAIVAVLLEAGADPTLRNRRGRTLEDPGHSPRRPIVGPRDPALEARILDAIRRR
ncbi:MAG: FAD/NAD(P)-binding protein [Sandaracinaceae bacterium]|nr:FAD/NAD(P)-binding protein [Sandaracinaceae bacterium]